MKKISKKHICYILIFIFAFIMMFSIAQIYLYDKNQVQENSEFENLKGLISESTYSPPASVGVDEYIWGDETPAPVESKPIYNVTDEGDYVVAPPGSESQPQETEEILDYSALKALNPDFVGWLSIPNTKLDYPVMQTNKKPDYYLRKNFYGKYSVLGTPYAEEGCDIDTPGDNITIYGHHIKDGSMFGSLEYYKDKSYYEEHKHIQFDTLTYHATYEIIAVFKTTVYTGKANEFKYWNFMYAENEEKYNDFIEKIKSLSIYDINNTATYGDKLISLSTCEYSKDNGRLVIVAKMIDKVLK